MLRESSYINVSFPFHLFSCVSNIEDERASSRARHARAQRYDHSVLSVVNF